MDPNLWSASDLCDRVRVGMMIFSKPSGKGFELINNTASFNWTIVDSNISIALTSEGQLWKFNSSINGFIVLKTENSYSFPSGSEIVTA